MSVTIKKGNIFTTNAQTIVNTVNCVGVMGAGIALECRLRFPEMFESYKKHCQSGLLRPGKLSIFRSKDLWILNFPTKDHWKAPSKIEYLEGGLEKFVQTYTQLRIESIAFPLLGADRGGIPTGKSEAIILQYLDPLELPVELYHYDPHSTDDLFENFRKWFLSGGETILRDHYGIRNNILIKISNAILGGQVCQLNQLGRIKGIGIKSLEIVFHAARSEMQNDHAPSGLDF